MPYPIGIDLGTTNSVVCVWRRGRVETINVDGRPTVPSVISVRPDGLILIGHSAKGRILLEPESSIVSVKRHIGDGKSEWSIHGKNFTPIDVYRVLLERLKKAAEDYLKEPVKEAVITVPAYFNNNRKRDTKLAAEAAGLKVLQLLPEPTSAAISYGLDQGKDQTILVYDLGGGTFDVSVLRVQKNHFTTIAVDGDDQLGGDDFDFMLVEYLLDILAKRSKKDVGAVRAAFDRKRAKKAEAAPKEVLRARQQLKEVAEKAKMELSDTDTSRVTIPDILGTSLDEEITLDTFNKLVEPLVRRTTDKMREVLKSARCSAADIDRVILVGGSTRNRLIKARVTAAIKEPWTSDRVDEAVAHGAAIVAARLSAPDDGHVRSPEEMVPDIFFEDVTSMNLGVKAFKDGDPDYFDIIIPKNTPLKNAEAEHEFSTARANQKSAEIAVYQGEDGQCAKNTFIGGWNFTGIPPAPAGKPRIRVRFKMDNSNLLTITAKCDDKASTKTLDISMVTRSHESPAQAPQADIIFLVDTSGSMSTELKGVKQSGLDFAKHVMEAGVDCSLGLMDFDWPGHGAYKWEMFGPMEPANFPRAVSGLRIGRLGGGGCYIGNKDTIPVIEAFADAFPDPNRTKIGILVSDEVGNDGRTIPKLVQILQDAQVTLHVVGVPSSCHEVLARETGGKFWDISASRGLDFSELLENIATEITSLVLR